MAVTSLPEEAAPDWKPYRMTLRWLGVLLLIPGVIAFGIGLITLVFLSWQMSYLEIKDGFRGLTLIGIVGYWVGIGAFFLIPGILLYRGSLRTAKFLR